MHISQETFKRLLVPPRDLPFWRYQGAVIKHYCAPLELRDACPGECSSCIPVLQEIFASIKYIPDLRSPIAMVVYKLKNAMAAQQEIKSAEEKEERVVRTDIYGIPTSERNPFLKFIK